MLNAKVTMDFAPLEQFMDGRMMNDWVKVPPMSIYLRKHKGVINGRPPVWVIQLANLNIELEEYKGKGYFTQLVEWLEHRLEKPVSGVLVPPDTYFHGIFVENVHYERFANKLVRMGFEPVIVPDYDIQGRAPHYFSPLPLPFGKLANVPA